MMRLDCKQMLRWTLKLQSTWSSILTCCLIFSGQVSGSPPTLAEQDVSQLWYEPHGDGYFSVGKLGIQKDDIPQVHHWDASGSRIHRSYGEFEQSRKSGGVSLRSAGSADGKLIATYYSEIIPTAGAPDFRSSLVVWSRDGKKVASLPTTFESSIADISFSPDGMLLAVAGGGRKCATEVFDIKRAANVATLQGHLARQRLSDPEKPIAVTRVAFSPDGKLLATGGGAGTLRVWSIPKFELISKADLHLDWLDEFTANAITGLLFTPDGRSIVSASFDGNVRVINPLTGQGSMSIPVRPRPNGKLNLGSLPITIALSQDGTRLATSASDRVAIWDLATGKVLAETKEGEPRLGTLAFSPGGTELVATRRMRGIIRWEIGRGVVALKMK